MLNCNEVASLIGDVILLQAMLLTENFWNGNGGQGKQKQRRDMGRNEQKTVGVFFQQKKKEVGTEEERD